MNIFKRFSKVKVLIIGDVMLDRFWWGTVTRISPEAPVPIIKLEKTSLAAGGAANVAANVAGLGAQPFLIGVIGDDDEARLLPDVLNSRQVSDEFLICLPTRQTTVKTRIIAHNQQIARLDQESREQINSAEEEKIWKIYDKLLKKSDVVIISDYNKGMLTNDLLARLITTARKQKKIVLVDPKGKNFSKYRGANVLTPNLSEFLEAGKISDGENNFDGTAGKKIISQLALDALLVTRGEEGMSLFEKNEKTVHIKATARDVYDVTGAGDTVIACLGVAVGCQMEYREAAEFANSAAGLVVEHIGTTPINLKMFDNFPSVNG